MAHTIAVCNQKGGVGKTTTAINVSAALALSGKRTLLVDLDPQGNAGSGVGINKLEVAQSIYHVLIGRAAISDVIRQTAVQNLSICPSNHDLAGAELELVGLVSRETRLKGGLASLTDQYDFIIMDCPPSLGLLTLNAITAANHIIIPVQAEYYAMEGIADLQRTIQLVRSLLNPSIEILGVLITMFDARNNLARQVAEELSGFFGEKIFNTIIPRNVRLSEAPSHGEPVLLYDSKSIGSVRYSELAHELTKRLSGDLAQAENPIMFKENMAEVGMAATDKALAAETIE